jgi:O-antigen/teichoic acid export membrane protein
MEDSLKKRYFFKLSTNLIGFAIGLLIQAIIPRSLGPKAYGDFTFLTNFFTEVVGFLDTGTSVGFYVKLSQKPQEISLVRFYLYFSGIVALGVLAFVLVTQASSAYLVLWPGQQLLFIYLAAVWGIMTWFIQVLTKMADAYGLTVSTEMARMGQKVLGLALIVLLFLVHALHLTTLFLYHYVIMAFLIVIFIWILETRGHSLRLGWKLTRLQVKHYIKEFYDYSHPLFVYALIGLIVPIFDRWLLQTFSGSIEQGFFGLSYQIGIACFLFTTALTQLLMREFAIAFGKRDLPQMTQLFRRYIPLIYSISAYFCCFIAVQANMAIFLMGGAKFQAAQSAMTIMAFFPIHATYGQLSSSVFYATGQTALYRNIGITMMLLGLPLTYLFIAPHGWGGLNAGAPGLALKMVLLQFFWVNLQLYFNARLLSLRFWRYLAHQVLSVSCMLTLAILVKLGVDYLLVFHGNVLWVFLFTGVCYTFLIMVMVACLPQLFGLSRQDMQGIFDLVKKRFGFY